MAHNNPIRDSVLQAIGNTPVVKLRKVVTPSMADVLVKLEYYNPTGSYKDRMALAMIKGAISSLGISWVSSALPARAIIYRMALVVHHSRVCHFNRGTAWEGRGGRHVTCTNGRVIPRKPASIPAHTGCW
jgi:hypothetical protein